MVHRIDMFLAVSLGEDEVTLQQWMEVVAYHALFLSKGGGEFVYAHGLVHELFEQCQSSGI